VSENELELGIGFALATNIGARILAVTVIERLTSKEFHADNMSMGISKLNTVILRVSVIRRQGACCWVGAFLLLPC
jgi:hypothetical protein